MGILWASVCACVCVDKVDASEDERISGKYLQKVLFQFQIAHIQDTLNAEVTTLSLIFIDPVAYLLNCLSS